jgi:hypothetical protein
MKKQQMRADESLLPTQRLFYSPYLEHNRFPSLGEGVTEPERAGYRLRKLFYQFRPTQVLQYSGERFENLFHDRLIEAKDRKRKRIFILGASTARGHGVSVENTYHRLLENNLRRHSVACIPVAAGGFNSTQENLLFHLTVLPNYPDLVILLDGWNDIFTPANLGVRPGDPVTMSVLYAKYYGYFFNLLVALALRNAWIRSKFYGLLAREKEEFLAEFMSSSEIRKRTAESILNVYLSNVRTIIEGCRLRNIPVLHVLQPSADWILCNEQQDSKEAEGYRRRIAELGWTKHGLEPFIAAVYGEMMARIKAQSWARGVVLDLQSKFELGHFSDPVHLNEEGNVHLCELLTPIVEAVMQGTSATDRAPEY